LTLRPFSLIICLKHTIFTAEKYFYGIIAFSR
jgi:hypothetical protein